MANELTMSNGIKYQRGNSSDINRTYGPKKVSPTGTTPILGAIRSVPTSEEAIPLNGNTAAKALMQGRNLDDTNYLEIRNATGAGNDVVYVGPGEPFQLRFGTDVTTPYWIANTSAVLVEYNLIPY